MTFTDYATTVVLTPVPPAHGTLPLSWINSDPDQPDVVVVRVSRAGKPIRTGWPRDGYLVRVNTGPFAPLIWWTSSQAKAALTASAIIEDSPDRDLILSRLARPMIECDNVGFSCTGGRRCEYAGVGAVPYVWDSEEGDWACPKCGVIG